MTLLSLPNEHVRHMTPKDIIAPAIVGEEAPLGWKVLAANWLFHQGVSTVLLFCLVAVVIYIHSSVIAPQMAASRLELKEIHNEFNRMVEQQRTADQANVESIKQLVSLNSKMISENMMLLRTLTEEVRDLREDRRKP